MEFEPQRLDSEYQGAQDLFMTNGRVFHPGKALFWFQDSPERIYNPVFPAIVYLLLLSNRNTSLKTNSRCTWVAQPVKHLTLAQVMISES